MKLYPASVHAANTSHLSTTSRPNNHNKKDIDFDIPIETTNESEAVYHECISEKTPENPPKKGKSKRTTVGIRSWSPTELLIHQSNA